MDNWDVNNWTHKYGEMGSRDKKTGKLSLMKAGKLNQKEYDSVIMDLTNFITYMSEPDQLKRKKMGFYVVGFLLLLLVLTVKLKKEFWKDIK